LIQEEDAASIKGADTEPEHALLSPPLPPDPKDHPKQRDGNTNQPEQQLKQPSNKPSSARWYGWWSKPDGDGVEQTKSDEQPKPDPAMEVQEESVTGAASTPLPGPTPSEDTAQKSDPLDVPPKKEDEVSNDIPQVTGASSASQGKSWFWSWSSAQNARETQTESQLNTPRIQPADTRLPEPPKSEQLAGSSKGARVEPKKELTPEKESLLAQPNSKDSPKPKEVTTKPSSWAFWSKEKPGDSDGGDTASTNKQVGEIAVADTPSQNAPEAAQFNEHEQVQKAKESPKPARGRKRPMSLDSIPSTPTKPSPAHSPERKATTPSSPAKDVIKAQQQQRQNQPQDQTKKPSSNLVLPELRQTYSVAEQPTYWQQVRTYLFGSEPSVPHLHIDPNPPQIKKAIAIGVHGFFPAAMFQTIFGQPTGTSIKFANAGAKAIRDWTQRQGYECEIEKVALEGEGFIAERVDGLWKLLLNWIDHIRAADFIFVVSHSQGVPVATMLVAKLIQFGCTSTARIGMCAMAGVNLGPFPEYRTKLFGGSALELFDFCRPDSKVSMMYEEALEVVLGFGVKITYVGSIDDQLVPMEVCQRPRLVSSA